MNPNQPTTPPPFDPSKPVAYDQYGRPLYAHPSTAASPTQPQPQTVAPDPEPAVEPAQTVFMSRPASPPALKVTPEIAQKHAESMRHFPGLNLSDAEYIISAVRRHPIGIFQIWAVAAALVITFSLFALMLTVGNSSTGGLALDSSTINGTVLSLLFVVIVLASLGGFVATYIYNSNRFFLTNESVIQEIRNSIFSKREQTVSLMNIEDASFRQDGLLPHMFNYGTIRLSTEGDETTYRFSYVANPKKHIATLNNAIESFKNGRAID